MKVAYDDEVTAEQVKKIDDLVSPEFKTGAWETLERDIEEHKEDVQAFTWLCIGIPVLIVLVAFVRAFSP